MRKGQTTIIVYDKKVLAGLEKARRHLGVKAMGALLNNAAVMIESEAIKLAPVDTGALRASIHTVKGSGPSMWRMITPGVRYAEYVEYGTSRSPAQPFLRPALANRQQDILKAAQQEIKKALR